MLKRIRQYNYIKKIRKVMEREGNLKYLGLNGIKSDAAADVFAEKIDINFYIAVFHGETMCTHYTEVNKDYIMNYKFQKKGG